MNRPNKTALRPTLGQLGEWGFLNQILPKLKHQSRSFFQIPPGDDAVVTRSGRQVLSIDGLTQGTHFKLSWDRWLKQNAPFSLGEGLGAKLLGAGLSDLAAMGPTVDRWAMVYLGAPGTVSQEFLTDLFRGVCKAARRFKVALAGGDTVRASQISLVVAVGGRILSSNPFSRSGAQVGDVIGVLGPVGDAELGLHVLNKRPMSFSKQKKLDLVRTFFYHKPLFDEAAALHKSQAVRSLLDLSDPFTQSLEILCRASNVGATVDWSQVPRSHAGRQWVSQGKRLNGGEDYGLLMTLNPSKLKKISPNLKLKIVGRINTSKKGIRYYYGAKRLNPADGYHHF